MAELAQLTGGMTMSKISEQEMKRESEYLDKVLDILSKEHFAIQEQYDAKMTHLKGYRRYLWENRRDFNNLFDIAEYEDRLREDIRGYEVISHKKNTIATALKKPYFARIDFEEKGTSHKENIYIGLTSVINKEKFDVMVMDWRAPIASMYYDYELGKASYEAPDGVIEGNIDLKRQFKIKNGKLVLAVDTGIKIDDVLLLETLNESSNVKMQQIVYTIQKEQNQIIRNDSNSSLWIQGVAGSGKTSVALHRIAYLLYHNRNKLNSENIAIFSPHPVFIDYISEVLPELGETNATQLTFFDFAGALLDKLNLKVEDSSEQFINYDKRRDLIDYKTGSEFLEVISAYIEYLENKHWEFGDIVFANTKVFTAKQAEKLFNHDYAHIPINKRLEQVVNRIVYLVSQNYKKVNEKRLKIAIYEKSPKFDAYQLYKELFTDLSIWTRLGIEEVPENVAKICVETLKMFDSGKLFNEDIAPVLLIKSKFEDAIKSNKFLHVIIDEIQTYSLSQIKVLKEMFDKATFTFLGDIHQRLDDFLSWQKIDAQRLFEDTFIEYNLNKCYRSTKEIASLARAVLPESNLEIIERDGDIPKLINCKDENINSVIENLLNVKSNDEYETVAIIVKDESEGEVLNKAIKADNVKLITNASRKLIKGINIIPSYLIKGLEFDFVIVVNNDNFIQNKSNLLYTLITRALHNLVIVSSYQIELLNKAIDENLISVINKE